MAQSRNKADDKNEVLLRRLAFTDKSSNKNGSADAAKLQFKVNELSRQLEDLKYEKLHMTTKIKDLEKNLSIKSSKSAEDELKKKLQAAEQLCEELMDENAEVKKEMRSMEEEIDEMQDNFRDDRANEYTTAKKELEVTMKNCRILSFKLKKSERKIEQLELEKQQNASAALISQIKRLEEELRLSNERSQQLQARTPPHLSVVGDVVIFWIFFFSKDRSRESATRQWNWHQNSIAKFNWQIEFDGWKVFKSRSDQGRLARRSCAINARFTRFN